MHCFLFRLDPSSSSGLSSILQRDETHPSQRRNRQSQRSNHSLLVSAIEERERVRDSLFCFSHSFVNQFEKMDRSKSNSNYKDIICGAPFDAIGILQELSRLRHQPVEIIKTKQEDAHELLCQLLSEIHDEICQILYHSSSNKNGKRSKSAVGIQNPLDIHLSL